MDRFGYDNKGLVYMDRQGQITKDRYIGIDNKGLVYMDRQGQITKNRYIWIDMDR